MDERRDTAISDEELDKTHPAQTLMRHEPAAAIPPPAEQRLGDFVLVRELGRGSFARVYLAHQCSLGRRVALKLSRQPSHGEALTLAGLEHDHIVKVYSEFHDEASGQTGLVLQYVPGTSLADIIPRLFRDGRRPSRGKEILDAIDQLARDDVEFDPALLRDRELLAQGGYVASVCRLGARLAEALAYAHARRILHCDIKPGNILINRYGRPMVADFNLAVAIRQPEDRESLGGTMAYMSPEQFAVFAQHPSSRPESVDHRTDLYALALVLLEMLVGKLPAGPLRGDSAALTVETMLKWKQRPAVQWAPQPLPFPLAVWRVLERCLDPDPSRRYAGGAELARALNHAAVLLDARSQVPPGGRLAAWARRWPILTLVVLTLVPHLVASAVNIAYNTIQIPLAPEQQQAFNWIILGYNLIIYPLCFALAWHALAPLGKILRTRHDLTAWTMGDLDSLRARALKLRWLSLSFALIGWLPGAFLFPLLIDVLAGPVTWTLYAHFLTSFLLSGLIALVNSHFATQFVLLRGIYPRLTHAEMDPLLVRLELDESLSWLGSLQLLAVCVPLAGAVLLLFLAPGQLSLMFRLLLTALIVAGMIGLGIAIAAARHLTDLVGKMQGRPPRPQPMPVETSRF